MFMKVRFLKKKSLAGVKLRHRALLFIKTVFTIMLRNFNKIHPVFAENPFPAIQCFIPVSFRILSLIFDRFHNYCEISL